MDVKPNNVKVSVDLKSYIDFKENISNLYVSKLADNEVDVAKYFFFKM